MEGRPGFQRLVAEVGLGHVGMVLGVEMSRLARSCRDWHQPRCGLRMMDQYNNNGATPRYACMRMACDYGEPVCETLSRVRKNPRITSNPGVRRRLRAAFCDDFIGFLLSC